MIAIEAVTTTGEIAALCQSVGLARATLYRRRQPARSSTPTVRAASPRALVPAERQTVLDVWHSKRFVDQSPAEVQATLLEEQTYRCSTRTMSRILDAAAEVRERRNHARHPAYAKPELVATAPNQIWSWDITKLKGPIPYLYYSIHDCCCHKTMASLVTCAMCTSFDQRDLRHRQPAQDPFRFAQDAAARQRASAWMQASRRAVLLPA